MSHAFGVCVRTTHNLGIRGELFLIAHTSSKRGCVMMTGGLLALRSACTSAEGRAENAPGLAAALQLSFHRGRPEGKQVRAESCASHNYALHTKSASVIKLKRHDDSREEGAEVKKGKVEERWRMAGGGCNCKHSLAPRRPDACHGSSFILISLSRASFLAQRAPRRASERRSTGP